MKMNQLLNVITFLIISISVAKADILSVAAQEGEEPAAKAVIIITEPTDLEKLRDAINNWNNGKMVKMKWDAAKGLYLNGLYPDDSHYYVVPGWISYSPESVAGVFKFRNPNKAKQVAECVAAHSKS